MRNDANDELEHIPSLTAGRTGDEPYPTPELEPLPDRERLNQSPARARRRTVGNGPLWSLVLALLIALAGLGWWSSQQVSRLERQLVATQESFARISEDAAGRLQDISGKVVATESNVTSESEAVKLRVKQLESQLADVLRQQRAFATEQQSLAGRQGAHDKRLEQLAGDLGTGRDALAKQAETVKALTAEQAKIKASVAEQSGLAATLEGLTRDIDILKKQGNPSQAVGRLEQDMLVLRSELENRPAQGASTAEFDAFRAQVTRNIGTLQSQVANLQKQLDGR